MNEAIEKRIKGLYKEAARLLKPASGISSEEYVEGMQSFLGGCENLYSLFGDRGDSFVRRLQDVERKDWLPEAKTITSRPSVQHHIARERIVREAFGLLQSFDAAVKDGLMTDVQHLVTANVFSDFLEMAEYLLSNVHKAPAASLSGAVLEQQLRQLCEDSKITVASKENISTLNKKLADNNVYGRLKQKEIEFWNDVRDKADHGHFDHFDESDVTKMIDGVRSFLASFP